MTSELLSDWDSRVLDDIAVRRATEADWDALRDCYFRAFGGVHTRDFDLWKRQFRLADVAVAEDVSDPSAPFIVGTASVIRMRVTVPGGGQLSVAACAQGMVATTHQKRGIYAKIQSELAAIALSGGSQVLAAMPGPGGNYGYVGVGAYARRLRVDRRRAKLRSAPGDSGPARERRYSESIPLLREIYDRWQPVTPGALSRNEFWWPSTFADDSCVITHPDGYVIYDLIGTTVSVRDFCAVTTAAHRELLRCLLGHGEYETVEMTTAVDDPTPLLLEDLRTASVAGVGASLWMWILDLPAAITARAFAADFHGVIELADPWGMSTGTSVLAVRDGAGAWTDAGPTAVPDLRIGPLELTSVYFGAHTVTELHRAGRVEEFVPGTVAALDRALAVTRRPFNNTAF
ncbi:GNAT family N-acetyltransferase [Nocardia sp. NPDC005978]|uniref:GNAT family N-acetyltransferase n=1 Tax=Nocardia sp. NPDC005978 TaxID=3156725 RepID=UPI0033AB0BEC